MGARIFEKHFTLSKKSNGPDHASSVTPAELKKYISDIYDTKLILGNFKKQVQKEELNMKRVSVKSITLNKDLKKQSTIKSEDICLKRPGSGLNGFFIKKIIGKMTKKNLKKNHQISLSDII